MPLMHAAAGLQRKAMAAPISWASPEPLEGHGLAIAFQDVSGGNSGLGGFGFGNLVERRAVRVARAGRC